MTLPKIIDQINAWVGSPLIVGVTFLAIVLDAFLGYASSFSGAWGNGTGIVTGLISLTLIVLLQHSQNRGNEALHLKLDLLILHHDQIDNKTIAAERLAAREIAELKTEVMEEANSL